MMLVVGGMLATTSCSDFNDYNSVPGASNPEADKTLWENISANADLSDFAAVVKRVGYDKVLNESHTYTVWAPVNGSFNKDSLAQVTDEKVIKEFLNNHIADFSHKENDPNDTIIYMLNEKLLRFTNKNTPSLAFDSQRVLPNAALAGAFNYPSTNGLLYVISAPATFRHNGYEVITEMSGLASKFFAYVHRYEQSRLDENASVKGEIRDGVQHYDDSVMIVTNSLVQGRWRAQLDNEDSTYTVLIPTDEAWDKSYVNNSSFYNYIASIDWQDLSHADIGTTKGGTKTKINIAANKGKVNVALEAAPLDAEIQETAAYWTDSLTKSNITGKLIFSENEKRYNTKLVTGAPFAENDTLYSTTHGYLIGLPELDAATQQIVKLSNGHARIVNDLRKYIGDTIHIKNFDSRLLGESDFKANYGRMVATGGKLQRQSVDRNLIDPAVCQLDPKYSSLDYLKIVLPETSNFAPELDLYIPNVLSTTYDVKMVIVPACVENPEMTEEEMKPYALMVDINYTDASNKQIAARFAGEGKELLTGNQVKNVEPFLVARNKVDTVSLGRITFPICYLGTGAKPNIKIMNYENLFGSSVKKKYEQMLRIADVILEPVTIEKENQNGSNE